MTPEDQKKVVDAAVSWLNTPYIANQRAKGLGVDCIQFLGAVFAEAGLFDITSEPDLLDNNYSVQAHWHSNDPRYIEGLLRHSEEVPESDAQPGDVVMFWIGAKDYNHAGIIMKFPECIHADLRGVSRDNVLTRMVFKNSPRKYFRFKK
jgi:cell wall-associated NlpC family hydrolase